MPRAPDDVESGREGPADGSARRGQPSSGVPTAHACAAGCQERVTSLEGQADNHIRAIDGLRIEIGDLRTDVRIGAAQLRTEMAQLRSDMATRSDVADRRTDMSRCFEVMDAKIDRHFAWLVGMIVTGFVTVIGALVGIIGVLVGVVYR